MIQAGIAAGACLLTLTLAQASADAGVPLAGPGAVLSAVVRYLLLQPLALWLLEALQIRWWTWPGALLLVTICIGNGLLWGAAVWAWYRARRR